MKKNRIIIGAFLLLMVSCGSNSTRKANKAEMQQVKQIELKSTASTVSLSGTYQGTIPAADCPGIATTLTLSSDGKYTLIEDYLERDTKLEENGTYSLSDNVLTLNNGKENVKLYQVDGTVLRMLNADLQPVSGELAASYELHKTSK